MNYPRIATIQDLSCFGKCSLTVALPVISAAGVETSVIPTAVLSTHTAYKDFIYRDLTDEISNVARHWQELSLSFDGIYTGYIGTMHQLEVIKDFINTFKESKTKVVVDPVMGDGGKLYTRFDGEFVSGMRALCSCADIIVPNLTEAAFILGRDYRSSFTDYADVYELLDALYEMCSAQVVITGVSISQGKIGAAWFDGENRGVYEGERINGSYHGTGDAFASALSAAVVKGKTLEESTCIAVDFTAETVRQTAKLNRDSRQGTAFEYALPMLMERLKSLS